MERAELPTPPARFRVGIVGAGRVGSVLGAALARAGHSVVAVSAVSEASRERAARLLPGVPIRDIPDVLTASDLVVFAVPDDALIPLVHGLAETDHFGYGQLVAHTSGRHGLAPLWPAADRGCVPLALHPAMTFTGGGGDLDRLADCAFGVTAPEMWRPVAEALVIELGADPVWIADADRVAYHAALAHGANHLVTLIAQSSEILRGAGVAAPDRVLRPRVEAALDNALRGGDAALTGPVSRGDAGTVEAHLTELSTAAPDILMAYRALALATAQRAVASGRLRPDLALPVVELLEDR
ncbi:MAG: Rossmann-like and DUF2520 domain-containing protein [Nostocoides sp.]